MAAFSPNGVQLTGQSYGVNPFDFNRVSEANGRSGMQAQAQALQQAMKNAGPSPEGEMAANRQRITDLTEGRADELRNDPRMNQAMDFFGSVLNGSKVPFSEETQRAQLNQRANGTAAANASQLRALEEAIVARGGSLQDPSFLAQKQEMMANRQGQNLDALGQMLSQAGIANYNAQASGANSLAGIRSGQNNQINQMGLAGAGYRAQDFRDVPTTSTTTFFNQNQQPVPQIQQPQYNPQAYVAPPPPVATRPAPTPTAAPVAAPRPSSSSGTGMGYAYNPATGQTITTGGATGPFWPGVSAPAAPYRPAATSGLPYQPYNGG